MKQTPFMYLKENLHKINFACDDKYKEEYYRAFSNVLDRLDKYFIENKLYDSVDYMRIVENMISNDSQFKFTVDKDFMKDKGAAGMHIRYPKGVREISISSEYMGKGTVTEGILCHEFFHYLTLGPEVLVYNKDGENYEVQLPVRAAGITIGGMKRNMSKGGYPQGLDSGDALDGGFICEALTELSKQQIYEERESFYAYTPQTSLVNLMNELTGTRVNIQDFLRGDLPNYVTKFGRKNFEELVTLCNSFQDKFDKNIRIDFTNDPDYLKASNIICTSILKNVYENTNNYSIDEFTHIASVILSDSPYAKKDPKMLDMYKQMINVCISKISKIKTLDPVNEMKFKQLLTKTIDELCGQRKNEFEIKTENNLIRLKTTDKGLLISFNNGEYIDSNYFPSSVYVSRIISGTQISKHEDGSYSFTFLGNDNKRHTIQLVMDNRNNKVLIKENNRVYSVNLETKSRRAGKIIKNNLNLLNNFEHYEQLSNILSSNTGGKIYQIKKVVANNGKEYLIANSNGMSTFYRIVDGKYKKVEIESIDTISSGADICDKQRMPMDNNTFMVRYAPNGIKTEGITKTYTLEDGTTFFRYYNDVEELVGQQINKSNDPTRKPLLVSCPNITLFDTTNPDVSDILGSNVAWNNQEIKREPSSDNGMAEQLKIKRERELRRQQEIEQTTKFKNRVIQENRNNRQVSIEEQNRRDRLIEEERRRRQEREKNKSKMAEEMERKAAEEETLYDEYGVEVSKNYRREQDIQREHQNLYNRGIGR